MSKADSWMLDLRASDSIVQAEARLAELSASFPADERERLHQAPLFLLPHVLRRIAFFSEIYQRILAVPGAVMEFGVWYGRDLAILDGLRTVYEPLNYSRKIVGFDTFTGFPAVEPKDGAHEIAKAGALATAEAYDEYLRAILVERERMAPYDHIRKFEVVRGDACQTLETYLAANPQTIVAFAYFDMDLYEPTKRCLELLRPHLTRGSVLGFDELNCGEFPGETVALREVLGLDRVALRRPPGFGPGLPSYLVME
jgi:Macrocin-O-methyltransferase (TylF)